MERERPPEGGDRRVKTRRAPRPYQALGPGGRSHPRPCCLVRHRRPGGDERNSKRPHGIGESGVCASSGVHCVHRPPTSHARSSTAQVVGFSSESHPCEPLRLLPLLSRIPELPWACSGSAAFIARNLRGHRSVVDTPLARAQHRGPGLAIVATSGIGVRGSVNLVSIDRIMDVQDDLPGRPPLGIGRLPYARSGAAPRPVADGCVAGWFPLVVRHIRVVGLPRGLGENRLVGPDQTGPPRPEFCRLARQDRCGQVGPGTPVAFYCLHERDGLWRLRQPRVFEPGPFARSNQRSIGRHRPDDASSTAARIIGMQLESRLEPKRVEDTNQATGRGVRRGAFWPLRRHSAGD